MKWAYFQKHPAKSRIFLHELGWSLPTINAFYDQFDPILKYTELINDESKVRNWTAKYLEF